MDPEKNPEMSVVKRIPIPRESPYHSNPALWIKDLIQNSDLKVDKILAAFDFPTPPTDRSDLDRLFKAWKYEVSGTLHGRHVFMIFFALKGIVDLWLEAKSETEPIEWEALKKALYLA